MVDIFVGLIVLALVGAALRYIRKEKKNGAACIGCSSSCSCRKKQDDECACYDKE